MPSVLGGSYLSLPQRFHFLHQVHVYFKVTESGTLIVRKVHAPTQATGSLPCSSETVLGFDLILLSVSFLFFVFLQRSSVTVHSQPSPLSHTPAPYRALTSCGPSPDCSFHSAPWMLKCTALQGLQCSQGSCLLGQRINQKESWEVFFCNRDASVSSPASMIRSHSIYFFFFKQKNTFMYSKHQGTELQLHKT